MLASAELPAHSSSGYGSAGGQIIHPPRRRPRRAPRACRSSGGGGHRPSSSAGRRDGRRSALRAATPASRAHMMSAARGSTFFDALRVVDGSEHGQPLLENGWQQASSEDGWQPPSSRSFGNTRRDFGQASCGRPRGWAPPVHSTQGATLADRPGRGAGRACSVAPYRPPGARGGSSLSSFAMCFLSSVQVLR